MEKWCKRWPSFTPKEIYSPQSLFDCPQILDPNSLDKLQTLRFTLDKPILVNYEGLQYRGVRTIKENNQIKGASNSMHLHGRAFDITVKGMTPENLAAFIKDSRLFNGIGIYPSWVHVDTRFDLFNDEQTVWGK